MEIESLHDVSLGYAALVARDSWLTSNCHSCTDKAQPQERTDQVQGPVPEEPLHPRPQGLREGREAQAVPPTKYVPVPPP